MKNLIITSMLFLASCAGLPPSQYDVERLANEARERDQNPNQYAYKEGTKHGCSSGNNATGDFFYQFQKDVDKYVNNPYYKSGWDDGFAKCKGQGEMINGVINSTVR